MRELQTTFVALLLTLVAVAAVAAEERREVFVGTGEHGEPSFSDVARPGAERIVVEVREPAEDALAELDHRIRQTLTVADALEASRLARERARAEARVEARAAAARPAPAPVVVERYVSSPYLRPPHDRHRFPPHRERDHKRHGAKDDRPADPAPREISRPIVFNDDSED